MTQTIAADRRAHMLSDVRAGFSLPQKELPPTYFYDERGSALFEEITRLPEYYLTRAERALLEKHSALLAGVTRAQSLVELGAGSATKSRILLAALASVAPRPWFVPVDVSASFIDDAVPALRNEFPDLVVAPVVADMRLELTLPDSVPHPVLCALLGSTVGNFTAMETTRLFRRVAAVLRPDDFFLLGVDLVKDVATIEAAYNDSRGVTAEFNKNVLLVLNRELGADFDVGAFRHQAFYNAELRRVEMHLVSVRPQTVTVPDTGEFSFEAGESIRTEISCKYDRASVEYLLKTADFRLVEWLTDDAGFALALAALSR